MQIRHAYTATSSKTAHERGSILIISNRSVGEWGEVFGDAVAATAILDRLLHHSRVLTISGESYGLREKHRAGVLGASASSLAKAVSHVRDGRGYRAPDRIAPLGSLTGCPRCMPPIAR